MLKHKISHLKNKPHQKVKTLDSFCKYQSNRFNQATFQEKFYQNHQNQTIHLSQTDIKIQEIKKKYGIPPRNVSSHQRYHSVDENSSLHQGNLEKSKLVLKQRSLSNFTNQNLQKDLEKSRKESLKSPIKSSQKQDKVQSQKGNENNFLTHPCGFCVKEGTKIKFSLDYNDTFNKEIFRKSTIHREDPKFILKGQIQTDGRNIERQQILESRRSRKINHVQKDFWSSAYIPRVQNIEKINVKIKSALQNFQNFEKRDISIPLSKTKVQNTYHFQSALQKSTKRSKKQNDLIETRVLQSIPCHRRTTSYLTTLYNHTPVAVIKTEGNDRPQYKKSSQVKFHTQASCESRYSNIGKEKLSNRNTSDNLFSRIKSLYKRSEELQEKKAEIMDFNQRQLSHEKIQQKANRQIEKMRSSQLAFDKMDKLREIKNKYISKTSYRSTYTQNQRGEKNEKRVTTVRKNKSPEKLPFDLIYVKEDKSESYGDEIQDFDKNQDQVHEFYASQLEQIIKLTKSGIETRKKTKEAIQISNLPENSNQNPNPDFCNLFKKQIELDQNFRKVKFWFRYEVEGRKWQQLNQKFLRKIQALKKDQSSSTTNDDNIFNLNFLISKPLECHSQNFEMLDQEIDPFFSLRVCQFTHSDIIETYLQAQNHWNKICRSGLINRLIQNKWIEEIDSDKKGYANLTDLTRFMNFQSQSFFKNRDLVLIFKRLTLIEQNSRKGLQLGVSNKKITYETLHKLDIQSKN